ncbi:hypothetical protein MHU86_3514 [Fragilaria crotonensis]|nr:hypothetical protein MHU86_3514 [Fragilaria crotonensis]
MNDDVVASQVPKVLHQVVTEWLGDPIERHNLTKAYDALIGCCTEKHNLQSYEEYTSSLHVLCDLYRALLVTSFLLRLQNAHSLEACDCLEKSVERCLWLLQILVAAPTSEELVGRLPRSSYPLLNSLLEEPLIPLHQKERLEFWWNPSNDDDNDDEEIGIEGIPDKKQLAIEERQLLDMARRPIPEPSSEQEGNAYEFEIDHSNQPLLLPIDVLVEDHGCKLYRCGILHLDDNAIVLTSKTSFKVVGSIIHLDLDEERCIHVQISPSLTPDWTTALETAIRQLSVQDKLRNQSPSLWNGMIPNRLN